MILLADVQCDCGVKMVRNHDGNLVCRNGNCELYGVKFRPIKANLVKVTDGRVKNAKKDSIQQEG